MMRVFNIALAAFLILSLHVQPYQLAHASRILYVEPFNKDLVFESLQRAPVPPSDASGCTNIPNTGGPGCPNVNTVKEMNVAGRAFARSSAYPRLRVEFGVATDPK